MIYLVVGSVVVLAPALPVKASAPIVLAYTITVLIVVFGSCVVVAKLGRLALGKALAVGLGVVGLKLIIGVFATPQLVSYRVVEWINNPPPEPLLDIAESWDGRYLALANGQLWSRLKPHTSRFFSSNVEQVLIRQTSDNRYELYGWNQRAAPKPAKVWLTIPLHRERQDLNSLVRAGYVTQHWFQLA